MIKTFSYKDALEESIKYFNGDKLAAKVFLDKYALRNENDELIEETPKDMHTRIAKEFARVEKKKYKGTNIKPLTEKEIFDVLDHFRKISPGGSPMAGIGNKFQNISISNCFAIASPEDSYAGVCATDEELAQISKRRGGVGTNLSNLRPAGSKTHNASKTSTGIIPFASRFSNTIREVGQGGRRGAEMLCMSIHHPESVTPWDDEIDGKPFTVEIKDKDIGNFNISSKFYNPNKIDFATCKYDKTKVTGANISIQLTDEFLEAVEKGKKFEQRWPLEGEKQFSRKVDAKKAWEKIIHSAWRTAEPGLLFWDTILRESPADCYADFGFRTVTTNPCGEIPLSPYDSCRLLSLNLFGFVKNPFTEEAYFDFEDFYNHAQIAQRLMDDLIDLEEEAIHDIIAKVKSDPEPDHIKFRELSLWEKILEACVKGRRTGTGLTAIGDTMAAVGIRYGSDESLEFVDKVYQTLKFGCYRASIDMSKEIGSFEVWDWELEKDNPFLNRIKKENITLCEGLEISGSDLIEDMIKWGRRNIALLTSAPTGSLSLLTQTTSGIEPVFRLSYTRRKKVNPNDKNVRVDMVDDNGDAWQHFEVHHNKFDMWREITGQKKEEDSPWFGASANELDWTQRIQLQGKAQSHIDHSISSTVNLPNDVPVETVANIYKTAWKSGCKGVTVYRDNCRLGVMIGEGSNERDNVTCINSNKHAPKRPKTLKCKIHHIKVTKKLDKPRTFDYLVIVGLLNNVPYEVFVVENGILHKKYTEGKITKVKRGKYKVEVEGADVCIENILDNTTEFEDSLTRLSSISLRHGIDIAYVVHQLEKATGDMWSFSKAVARALKKYIKNGTKVTGEVCNSCNGNNLVRSEGCITCQDCGHSKCG